MTLDRSNTLFNLLTSKLGIGIVLATIAIVYVVAMGVFKTESYTKRSTEADIIRFTGLPEDTQIKATIKNRSGVFSLPFKDHSLFLPPEVVGNFSLPYTINAEWKKQDGSYYDLEWSLDNKGVLYTIRLKGLNDTTLAALKMDNQETVTPIKPDWSGKIVFQSFINVRKNFDVCVDVKADKPFGVCQRIVGQRGTDVTEENQ